MNTRGFEQCNRNLGSVQGEAEAKLIVETGLTGQTQRQGGQEGLLPFQTRYGMGVPVSGGEGKVWRGQECFRAEPAGLASNWLRERRETAEAHKYSHPPRQQGGDGEVQKEHRGASTMLRENITARKPKTHRAPPAPHHPP